MIRSSVEPSYGTHQCTRRRILSGVSALTITGIAGCLDEDDESPQSTEPLSLDDGMTCDVCGMVIVEHFGPAGQLFYADGTPDGRDGPAIFDSIAELIVYHTERQHQGWELVAGYVTDYSTIGYELVHRNDDTFISTHVRASAFVNIESVYFVVDSEVYGAMGADYIPFSDHADATQFIDEHGGLLMEWDELQSEATV